MLLMCLSQAASTHSLLELIDLPPNLSLVSIIFPHDISPLQHLLIFLIYQGLGASIGLPSSKFTSCPSFLPPADFLHPSLAVSEVLLSIFPQGKSQPHPITANCLILDYHFEIQPQGGTHYHCH